MIFRYFVAILVLFSVPLMAAGQSDDFPLSNDTSNIDLEPHDVETREGIDLSSWIESTFLGVSDNSGRENVNKPIIRLASASESTLVRQPWRSIDDPERTGVFPFQPVRLNPRLPFGESATIFLTSGGHSCSPNNHAMPSVSDGLVETYFESTCYHPDEREYKWMLDLNLVGPHSNSQKTSTLIGNRVTFHRVGTTLADTCASGEWRSDIKLTYKRNRRFARTRTILNNTLYATITCP